MGWFGAGRVAGRRGRERSAGVQFVNAPAERCSIRRGTLGRRFVRYEGGDYTVMGLYYVPRPWKTPRPFFVLRRVDSDDGALVSVWSRERWRLRLTVAPFTAW